MISVILCTHNPHPGRLKRALQGLRCQSLSLAQWELLLVDNASEKPLATSCDLSWHPNGHHLHEAKLGLTPARLCGIRSAVFELLVFVDDDNVLDPTYLQAAVRLAQDWPTLGAWGGEIRPDFEIVPPDWSQKYWEMLAIRKFPSDRWSNLLHEDQTTPYGAGMVIRRRIALEYANRVETDPVRKNLDRKGTDLSGAGDCDLAMTSIDLGFGTGYFNCLALTHIIPKGRLTEDYLVSLYERLVYSSVILESFRAVSTTRSSLGKSRRWVDYLKLLRMNSRSRRFVRAHRRGIEAAIAILDARSEEDSK